MLYFPQCKKKKVCLKKIKLLPQILYASLFNEKLYKNPCKKGYKKEYAAAMCLWRCEQHWVWKMLILQAFYLLAVSCLKPLNLLKIKKKW